MVTSNQAKEANQEKTKVAYYLQPKNTQEFFYMDKDGKTVLDVGQSSSFHKITLSSVYDKELKMHVVTFLSGGKIFG